MSSRPAGLVLGIAAIIVAARGPSAGEGAAETAAVRDRIAVVGAGGGIDLITPRGRRVAMLTRHRGWNDSYPAWSPDGRSIAFTRTKDNYRSFHIYVMRADGSRVRRISDGRFDERPAWSPDGRWIAYSSTTGIRIIRPDGTGMRRISTPDEAASHPAWAPAGRISYSWHPEVRSEWPARCMRQGSGCGWVWTSRLDGTKRRALVRGRDARWSPDGRRAVLTPPDGGVATIPADGGRSRLLGPGFQADWSRDGRRIVYTRMGATPTQDGVWVMGRDGSQAHLIRPHASMPAWRP